MSAELFDQLEKRVVSLLDALTELKRENRLLNEENRRLKEERSGLKVRIDSILQKMEGV